MVIVLVKDSADVRTSVAIRRVNFSSSADLSGITPTVGHRPSVSNSLNDAGIGSLVSVSALDLGQ